MFALLVILDFMWIQQVNAVFYLLIVQALIPKEIVHLVIVAIM